MIYFVQVGRRGPIKIGYTDNVCQRLATIQSHNPFRCRLLGVIDGDADNESWLHAQFSSIRIRGEWFKPELELREFIALLLSRQEVLGSRSSGSGFSKVIRVVPPPELKSILVKAAGAVKEPRTPCGIPASELVVRILAAYFNRPDLAYVPRAPRGPKIGSHHKRNGKAKVTA